MLPLQLAFFMGVQMSSDEISDERLSRLFSEAWKHRGKAESESVPKVNLLAKTLFELRVFKQERGREANPNRLTVEDRLLLAFHADQTRVVWSKREWAEFLECSETAIQKTKTWRTLQGLLRRERAESKIAREVTGQRKRSSGNNGKS